MSRCGFDSRAGHLSLVLLAALVSVAAFAALTRPDTAAPREPGIAGEKPEQLSAEMLAGIPQRGTQLGDPDAPVTLTEYADLQCPYCRDYALDVLPHLIEEYVRPGKVKLELRVLRFLGPDSRRAAGLAAAAAAQNRLWNVADLFYRWQGEENSGYVTGDFMSSIARSAPGLDAAAALRERSSKAAERTARGWEAAAKRAGVDSTPSFQISAGGATERFQPRSLAPGEFRAALDSALASAGAQL